MVMKRDRLIANSSTRNPLVVELDYSLKGMRNSIDKSLANLDSFIHPASQQPAWQGRSDTSEDCRESQTREISAVNRPSTKIKESLTSICCKSGGK